MGDKEYQYNKAIGNAGIGSIVDVELSSKGIEKVGMGKKRKQLATSFKPWILKELKYKTRFIG